MIRKMKQNTRKHATVKIGVQETFIKTLCQAIKQVSKSAINEQGK